MHDGLQADSVLISCRCRLTPLLRGVREEARDGAYTLVLEFETKEQMTLDMWETRLNKIQGFFGPGILAEVSATQIKGHLRAFLAHIHHDAQCSP